MRFWRWSKEYHEMKRKAFWRSEELLAQNTGYSLALMFGAKDEGNCRFMVSWTARNAKRMERVSQGKKPFGIGKK